MPKVKLGRDTMNERLTARIWGAKEAQHVTSETMCRYAKCSHPKLARIKKEPTRYLPEVLMLGRSLGVPIEEIRAEIVYPW